VVPREAIVDSKSGPTVAVVDETNTAHVRPVTTGASDAANIEIVRGVQPRERVVVLSYSPVKDGQKVKIQGGRR
jgi:hypothetical protein